MSFWDFNLDYQVVNRMFLCLVVGLLFLGLGLMDFYFNQKTSILIWSAALLAFGGLLYLIRKRQLEKE
jgi:hypothetical protein